MQIEIDIHYLDSLSDVLERVNYSLNGSKKVAVAGGAIRDMLFQKPISDIDVFYSGQINEQVLKEFFPEVETKNFSSYPSGFTVTHVTTHQAIPVPIQLIQVDDVYKHIETFPSPMCRVYFDYEKGLQNLTPFLISDVSLKWFVWDKEVDWKYYEKISNKYDEYTHKFTPGVTKPQPPVLEPLDVDF